MQRLASCRSSSDMMVLGSRAEYEFAVEVNVARRSLDQPPYVRQAKVYVENNINRKFRIQDIAKEIGVDRTYLSKIFTQAEGMSIQDYLIRQRCLHAVHMLENRSYTISEIADYYCFSSQSHFGVQFKKVMGVTPGEYRDRHFDTGRFLK